MRFEKGHIPWNKGKCHPSVVGDRNPAKRSCVRVKLSNSAKNNPKHNKFKIGNKINLGRKLSKNHKKKVLSAINTSEARKKNAESNRSRGKNWYKRFGLLGVLKQQTMKEPTSIEKKVYDELENKGLFFETQRLINGRFLVDAYIPSLNLIVECDGNYWHSLDRVKRKDKAENAYLKKCGYNLLRLSESEINNGSFKKRLEVN